jgi:hypothetical protein
MPSFLIITACGWLMRETGELLISLNAGFCVMHFVLFKFNRLDFCGKEENVIKLERL